MRLTLGCKTFEQISRRHESCIALLRNAILFNEKPRRGLVVVLQFHDSSDPNLAELFQHQCLAQTSGPMLGSCVDLAEPRCCCLPGDELPSFLGLQKATGRGCSRIKKTCQG